MADTAVARRYFDADSHILEPSRQVKFTPFPKDDVGWVIDQVGPELLLFSTDFPHPEGTRDPIGRFEAHLERFDDDTRERLYVENMRELLGAAVPAA
jgi:hypothetical protein